MLIETIPAWVAETNAYIVADEPGGKALVVDVPPEPDAIGEYLAKLDLVVVGILLTHGHVDHMGGSGVLASATGADTYIHPDDDFLTLHPAEQLRSLFGVVPPGSFHAPPIRKELEHGQMISLAGLDVEVLHTPGHTPGHCCFLVGDEGILFSGDQLFAGSVGRTDLPGGSLKHLMMSMRDIVMPLDDQIRVLPGHGPQTTIGRERTTNPFRNEWV